MSYLNEGAILCYSCFQERKNKAIETKTENIMKSNWGLYLIPIVNSITMFSKANKCQNFPDGNIYHVYINDYDEQWSKNKNFGSCSECKQMVNTYFQLENKKYDFFTSLQSAMQSYKNIDNIDFEKFGLIIK